MKSAFTNKKILIPIIASLAVIIIAVVVIIIIGSGNKKTPVSQVKFNDTNSAEEDTNVVENITDEEPEEPELEIDENIPDLYKEVAEQYAKALTDKKEMETFLEEYLDVKAYVAYERVDGDNEKFIDEYADIDDDDDDVEKVKKKFEKMATTTLTNNNEDNQNETENMTENEVSNDVEENTSESSNSKSEYELVGLNNLQKSESVDEITKVDIVLDLDGEKTNYTMIFYEELVIFIIDDEQDIDLSGSDFVDIEEETDTSDIDDENATDDENNVDNQ